MWIWLSMWKIRLFHWFVLEIRLIKESWNLIGWKHFGPYLRNKNFPKYGVFAGTQQIIWIFVTDEIQQKIITKFSDKLKKTPVFGPFLVHFPNFGAKENFAENSALSHTTSHRILAPCQTLEKINDTNPRKHPDRRKEKRTEERTDPIS